METRSVRRPTSSSSASTGSSPTCAPSAPKYTGSPRAPPANAAPADDAGRKPRRRRSTRRRKSTRRSRRRVTTEGASGDSLRSARYRSARARNDGGTMALFGRKNEMPTRRRGAPRPRRDDAGAGRALRQRHAARAAVPRRARAGGVRHGLLLGRRAQVLGGRRRVHHRGRLRRRASRPNPTYEEVCSRPHRPHRGRARGVRPQR